MPISRIAQEGSVHNQQVNRTSVIDISSSEMIRKKSRLEDGENVDVGESARPISALTAMGRNIEQVEIESNKQ